MRTQFVGLGVMLVVGAAALASGVPCRRRAGSRVVRRSQAMGLGIDGRDVG